jgi:hypothetical protein
MVTSLIQVIEKLRRLIDNQGCGSRPGRKTYDFLTGCCDELYTIGRTYGTASDESTSTLWLLAGCQPHHRYVYAIRDLPSRTTAVIEEYTQMRTIRICIHERPNRGHSPLNTKPEG